MPSLTLRKPSAPPSPDAVAAFVDGGEPDAPEPRASAKPATAAPLRSVPAEAAPPSTSRPDAPTFRRASRSIVERRTKPARRRTTVYLDIDVAHQLAQVLADRDQELSDAVNDAVRAWLGSIK